MLNHLLASDRRFPAGLTRHAYWAVVAIPLLMPLSWNLRNLPGMSTLFAWVPVAFLYGLLPLADALLGRDRRNPAPAGEGDYPDTLVPVTAAGVYLAVLGWSLAQVADAWTEWPPAALIGWTVSLGNIGGIAAINVAHELVHRPERGLRRLGGVLLAAVCYPGFKLEHVRWHHLKVATPADPASAPLDSTVYGRVPRALVLNTIRGWKLAVQAARAKDRRLPWLLHEMTLWWGLSLLFGGAAYGLAGATGAVLFIVQGLLAAALLEVINYVEHYGLRRRETAGGQYERPGLQHSWNADFWLSNAILLQLQRHSDHHVNPNRPFTGLQTAPQAPQLPMGYAAMSVIAFLPPLWRRVIHPRLPR